MAGEVARPEGMQRLRESVARRLFRMIGWRRIEDARVFVGTTAQSGQLQFELLKREGCLPGSQVLEVGCGCLHAGVPLMNYLDPGHYAGIDPNQWLREKAMEDPAVRDQVAVRRARFLSVEDFDGSAFGTAFDFVLSHSVLSHAAHWQLELFLRNVGKVIAPRGRILASIRLAEGNRWGSKGTPDGRDSRDDQWVYPGVSWFALPTVIETARKVGLDATHVPEYTEFYTRTRSNEYHDWMVFTRIDGASGAGRPG